jgi:hypothetical protein
VTSSKKEQQYPGIASSRTLPRRIQWVAAAAGCVTGVALLGLSWIVSLLAVFLIIAAAVPSWFPRAGRWLILVPALVLSSVVFPISFANSVELVRDFVAGPRDIEFLAISLSWLLSPILLIWCVTAVVANFVKHKRASP